MDLQKRGNSQSEISSKSKIHPFVVSKLIRNLSGFRQEELVELYGKLLSFDIGFKKGNFNLEDCLYRLILT